MRTLVESNASAVLVIPGADPAGPDWPGQGCCEARVVTPEGDVLLLVPAASPAARAAAHARDGDLAAVMEITDVAPVAVPHRVRGRARVTGWLTPVSGGEWAARTRLRAERHPSGPLPGPAWTPLRLEVGEGWIGDLRGEGHVEPDEFAAASPDPLARHEAELLQHLAAAHDDLLRGLCSFPDERGRACEVREAVVPVALDRFGLRVRFRTGGRIFDALFDFPRPVRDVSGLRRAIRALFEAGSAS
ncbi:DUF2470 domain-containing protein [Streptomyces sp. CNQ085]|nr:DUF2470 domain-containing protein [Streptomyces sp. CNQ085]MCI0383364.1 DUF2470 domain-containing protein [Streptomyces sp. CNQ085]